MPTSFSSYLGRAQVQGVAFSKVAAEGRGARAPKDTASWREQSTGLHDARLARVLSTASTIKAPPASPSGVMVRRAGSGAPAPLVVRARGDK